ncbi:hypothetical protein HZS_758 [Henneguya salminicola]|nr:hypothetical protein HZS_758 [Henneguya salminicola]
MGRNTWQKQPSNFEIHDYVKEELPTTSLEDTIQFVLNNKPHSHYSEPFKFAICKVINKIKSTAFSSSNKPRQIVQNSTMNLPAKSIAHFPSKNSTLKIISLMRSSLNVKEPREWPQINFPKHLKNTIPNQHF